MAVGRARGGRRSRPDCSGRRPDPGVVGWEVTPGQSKVELRGREKGWNRGNGAWLGSVCELWRVCERVICARAWSRCVGGCLRRQLPAGDGAREPMGGCEDRAPVGGPSSPVEVQVSRLLCSGQWLGFRWLFSLVSAFPHFVVRLCYGSSLLSSPW